MAHRIEVILKPGIYDAQGEKTAARIREDLGLNVKDVRTAQVYTVDADLSRQDLEALASGPFCDPVVQEAFIDAPACAKKKFDWLIEVGFLPGVTDNIGRTARESAEIRLGRKFHPGESVYSSVQFLIAGDLMAADADRLASGLLANKLIQRWTILPASQVDRTAGLTPHVPKVSGENTPKIDAIDLELDDGSLAKLSRERTLALSVEEMHAIRDFYRSSETRASRKQRGLPSDKPTDVELEMLAQTWSEHCKHKIFSADIEYQEGGKTEKVSNLFGTYIKGSTKAIREAKGDKDFCLSVFVDNAGVIKFNDDWSLVMKVETHNSPSALDPYGGALTGIVGVNRDPFGTGQGAKLIFNTDVFCFASPFWNKPLPPRLLHPKRIFEGVREGVEHGGNKSGIPTVNGSIVFDERFAGKPLVFCGTGGLLPAKVDGRIGHEKEVNPGDLAVMAGGRIGADGIHGATFSSEELHEGSPATAVQIGDPITQKRMTDFLLVARDRLLYRAITDNGAGGLASSIGEMARMSGGCEIRLDQAPLKYTGLEPWMILVSESQERMSLAVPEETREEFFALATKMDVEVTVVGRFTDTGNVEVYYKDRLAACLPMDFLHDGVPTMQLTAVWTPPAAARKPGALSVGPAADQIKRLLARLNVCSKEYVVRQYDHEVQAGSVVKPLSGAKHDGPSDAAVWRPILSSMEAVVVSHGICPRYSDVDTYDMAANAIDEAVRNAVATGGDPEYMAGLDNFCWCDPVKSLGTPDGEYKLAQLVRANKALYDATVAYGIPCVSGKDSMKNDYMIGGTKISIPPTLLYTVIGRMEDACKAVTMDAKRPGDIVYVLGVTRSELGCSEYAEMLGLPPSSDVPKVRLKDNFKLYKALHAAMKDGLVRSCHDCSDGGLAVAGAETAFAGDLGLTINLSAVPFEGAPTDEEILFSESAGRFIATVSPASAAKFENALSGCASARVGEVTAEKKLEIVGLAGKPVCVESIDDLKKSWKATLNFGHTA